MCVKGEVNVKLTCAKIMAAMAMIRVGEVAKTLCKS